MNFTKYLMGCILLRDEAGDGKGGGGGGGGQGGSGGGAGSGGNAGGGNADQAKLIESLQKSNQDLLARLEKLEGKGSGSGAGNGSGGAGGQDDPSLADKARKQREDEERKAGESKQLEAALSFNLGAKDWQKNHASLLPKTIEGIFVQAEKENYGNAIEKANAIKVGIVSEFFAQQSNLDLLTPGMKTALEDFQKLTKNTKHERVTQLWDQVFEPALEMLRRTKKAEQLNRGLGAPTDVEEAYKQRLIKGSRTHYLGEKQNGT